MPGAIAMINVVGNLARGRPPPRPRPPLGDWIGPWERTSEPGRPRDLRILAWRLRRVAVFEATLRQINGLIAHGRYADFVQVSLVTNVPIRHAETNGDLVSSQLYSANCGKPSASGPVAIGVPSNNAALRGANSRLNGGAHGSSDVSLSRALLSQSSGGMPLGAHRQQRETGS